MIKKLKAMFKAVRSFLWVLQAFLRGKVLRQKAYRPQGNIFRLPVSTSARRIKMLVKWWGFRPATTKELMELIGHNDPYSPNIPYLNWDDATKGWANVQLNGCWNQPTDRFIGVRGVRP